MLNLDRIRRKFRNLRWEFRYRFIPRHKYNIIRTGLPPDYYDIDTVMLHGVMALLCRYVEIEQHGIDKLEKWAKELLSTTEDQDPYGWEQSRSQGEKEKELSQIYRWWKETYPKQQEQVHDLLMNGDYLACSSLEEKIVEEEDEMLHRLIQLRHRMWT